MPIYSIQGPDGITYEIEGPEGATKAQVVAAVQAKMQASAPAPAPVPMPAVEPVKKEGFGAALGKGIENILSPSRTAIGALTGSAEEAALAGLKRSEESPYADQVSLDKVKQAYERGLLPAAGEVLRQIPLAITEQAPNIAATLGSARLGAMAGAGLGSVVPGLGTAVGTIGGGILGAVAPSLLQQFGGNIQRQAQEQLTAKQPVDISRTAAAAAALPQAGLDVAATFIPLGRTVAGSVLGPQVKQLLERGAKESAEKLARESLPKVLAKGAGISIATEAPTEAVQSMLERAQAGLPLLSEDALKEYGEAAYQASLIAPIGSAARVGERSTARQQTLPPENRPGETDRQAAERIQAEILAMKEAAKPPVAPSSPILSTNNLFNLMAQPNGYGLVEQYKQRLMALPKQTPEIEEAIEAATFAQNRADIEKAQRRTTKPAPEEVKDAGEAVTPPSGEGVQVAGEPDTGSAAERPAVTEPAGVVPAVEDAGQPPRGEAPAPAPVAPEVVTVPTTTRDAVEQHAVKGLPIIEAPIDQLTISKDVPQFKSEADERGVVKRLEGKFERTGVAPIQLWRRKDGRLEVISGRHRFDLAQRSGETTIPAQIHDEAAGFDSAKAGTLDAELNIRDEQGEVKDYVVYFERSGISEEDAKARGLLGRTVGQRGWSIASKGSPDLIAAHRSGIIPDDAAAGIANIAPGDARLQAVGLKAVRDNKSTPAVLNTMQAVKTLAAERGAPQEEAGDLFGFDDSAIKEAEEMARIATDKQREVSKRLSAIDGAAKNPAVAKAEGIDIKDEAALNKRIQELRQLRASWSNWSSSSDLIKEIRDEMTKPVEPKKSLVEMRKRYEAARAAPAPVETKPEPTELDKEIEAKIEELGRVLSRIMGKFGLKDVALKLVEDMKAEGEYAQSVVRLALDAASPVQALRHESIHALKELGFFSPQQWAVLEKQAKSKWIDQYLKTKNINKEDLEEGQTSRYDAYSQMFEQEAARKGLKGDSASAYIETATIEEAIADAFGDFDVNKAPPGLMQAILNRLRNFFDAVKTAFGGEVTAEQVFRKVEKGELKAEAAPATKEEVKPSVRSKYRIEKAETGDYSTGKFRTVWHVVDAKDGYVYDAFERKKDAAYWIEQAEAREAAESKPDIRYSLRDSLGLYSELENKVAQGPNKAPAASWKAYINGLTQKGVKPEEIEWSGVRDWLDLQTGPVGKDAVNAYLKQGGVRVEETVLGSPKIPDVKVEDITAEIDPYTPNNEEATLVQSLTFKPTPRSAAEEFRAFTLPNGIEVYDEYENLLGTVKTLDEAKMLVGKQAEASSEERSETRHGTWVLPGGTNYREVLLTLPSKEPATVTRFQVLTPRGELVQTVRDREKAERLAEGLEGYTVREVQMPGSDNPNTNLYRSNHWDQPNVLAHIRLNDRTDADGNKVLFVEEIQSDWGQQGKKDGFVGDLIPQNTAWQAVDTLDTVRTRAEAEAKLEELQPFLERNREPGMESRLVIREGDGFFDIVEESRSPTATAPSRYGIPRAPFVTKTEGWLNLALKRIMVMAAEGGYDKVAFVNGEQSADRYDLSKQISALEIERPEFLADGKYNVTMIAKDGGILTTKTLSADELPDNVGKELAQKIIDDDIKVGGFKAYRGLDLKVGGEGMKTFYNQIVPLAVKKLLPKVGGGQMGQVTIDYPLRSKNRNLQIKDHPDGDYVVVDKDTNEYFDPDMEQFVQQMPLPMSKPFVNQMLDSLKKAPSTLTQPGFDVTSDMKQKVETTGLPRFSLRSTIPTAARQRIVQTTVTRDEKTFYQRIIEAISPSSFQSFRADALNRYDRLGVYDKMLAKKMGGKALLASSSAEAAALLSDLGAGLTASALGVHDRMGGIPVYRNGITIISNMNGTVKGPTAIFAPLAREPGDYQAYQYWAAVKRGMRLMYTIDPKTGETVEKLITEADGPIAEALRKQYLKDFKIDFNAIQEDWIKYNNGLVDYMLATGVLSKERASLYKQYADYLPFYRQMNGEETVGPKIFQSIAGVKPPKKIKGGETRIDDFLENIVRNTQSAIQAGVKNIASKAAADVAVKIQMAERLDYQSSAPNVFHVYEDGKPVSYLTQDQLFINAIKSLGLPDLPFIGFLSGPANLLRNLVTKDPGFMLANLMRDSMSAWVTSGVKMTPMVDTISNFGSAIAGKSPEFQALMNAGILGGYEFSQNVEQSGREFGKALRKQAKVKQPGMKGVLEMGAKPFTSLWEALEKGSTASDAATRIEIYKKTLAETGNEAEALYRALEVMNFNRKGSSAVVRILTAAVPFLNARMQGLDVLYRASTGNMNAVNAKQIQKNFFVRGAMIAALSTAYWALTHDDDEYKKQEQETRDNYWLLPSLGVKIPIPFEIGVLFKVIPERILGYTMGSDTGEEFLKSMARQLTSTLAFNPIPQTVLPVVESMTNYSFFTMRPIVGQGLEGLEPAYQVAPGTTRIAEAIGSATKGLPKELQISPAKLDNLINGYTGTMGMYMVNLMDAIFDMNTDSPKPSRRFEQMPLIRRFAIDPEARGSVTGYYELKNSVDSIVRTSNMLERTMNYEELPGYLQDNAKMLATKDYLLDLEKTMKEFREMKIMIRSAKMSAEAKGDAIASIEKMENQLTANIQYLKSLAKGG